MSELKKACIRDYTKFENMSTEALEELLCLDSQFPNEDDSDIDAILHITEVIQKRADPAAKYSVDVEQAWDVFREKYLPYAQSGQSLYEDDEAMEAVAAPVNCSASNGRGQHRRRKWASHFLAAAAIFAALLCMMTATAYALGYDLWGVVASWTEETFSFVSQPESSSADREYADLQAALDAYGITEKFVPTWIPDGFFIADVAVEAIHNSENRFFTCRYESGKASIVITITMYNGVEPDQCRRWQKDGRDVSILKRGQTDVYIMTNLNRPMAVWVDGLFECCISGSVSVEELERIVESIN